MNPKFLLLGIVTISLLATSALAQPCNSDADCTGVRDICYNGNCFTLTFCNDQSECATGTTCTNFQCIPDDYGMIPMDPDMIPMDPDPGAMVECISDDDCQPGYMCAAGECIVETVPMDPDLLLMDPPPLEPMPDAPPEIPIDPGMEPTPVDPGMPGGDDGGADSGSVLGLDMTTLLLIIIILIVVIILAIAMKKGCCKKGNQS